MDQHQFKAREMSKKFGIPADTIKRWGRRVFGARSKSHTKFRSYQNVFFR